MEKNGRIALQGTSWGRLFPLLFFLVIGTTISEKPARAAEDSAGCGTAVARVVSIQGPVEVQRAQQINWSAVTRLDTLVCAGDKLRTGPLSRAALFIQPETLVRVDNNTTISINETADETVVEFVQNEIASTTPDQRPHCGAGYFITRFPKKFKVNTPFFNAAVEGTEFQVAMRCEASELAVFEGKVRATILPAREEHLVTSGQMLTAGPSTSTAIKTLIRPTDAVQWVLYYPPLSDAKSEGDVPTAEQCRGQPSPSDQSCLTQRAEGLLRFARIDEALHAIDDALALNSGNADANALRAIVQIAANDKAAAMQSASAATVASANSYRAWLALSYAQQAAFELEKALESASKALALEPHSSLVNARVAELLMSLGRIKEAETAARAAVDANPLEARAHTVLGFVYLAQINTKAARAAFEAAIERNSFDPLARLGLGLAIIRDGNLAEGREQIEIAVALDPTNSLLRSYVGKAYYEENSSKRDALASIQFSSAKELDPNDPTPWFYDSILKDSQTRPAEALQDLDKSGDLNDDRAVYRSRLLLDQDLAARNASQATVYNEIGFHQLGLTEAARSLAVDPASTSAHRFLADIYATVPRHNIARTSELLQAQLRQPLGAPPLQPQLANDVFFKNSFFGPATVGLNEFNPLFIQDGQDLQLFGLFGDNETYGNQAIFNGLHGPVSFSLSEFAANTDGYRPNNDDRLRQYDGFVQAQLGANTSAQVEVTSFDRESGDLTSSFDPTFFSDIARNDEDVDTQRFGLRQLIDPHSDFLLSVIRQDRHTSLNFDDPDFPLSIVTNQESWKAEVQYLTQRRGFDVILGAGYFDGDNEQVFTPPFVDPIRFKPRHVNAYGYLTLPARAGWPQVQLGASYDDMNSAFGGRSAVNPKIGVIWKIAESVTLRAAGFRVAKRQINSDQGLEPTQLAGLNQFFDDANGTVSDGGGLAADFMLSPKLAGGLEVTRRNLTVPRFDLIDNVFIFTEQREDVVSGYLYWLPCERLSVSLEPRYQDFEVGDTFGKLVLTEVPFAVRFFSSFGLWAGASVTGVKQRGEFTGPDGFDVAGSDSFWVVDAIVAYRLPRRMGTISVQGTNLFNETFQFQEIDSGVLPRYVPESRVLVRMSLSF
jgi:Tfp pilus assembly protein PilF